MRFTEKLKYLFFITTILYCSEVFAADPKFDLRLTNRNYLSSNEGYFDIVLNQTNPGQTDFPYAGGEYVIILNADLQTEHLNYIYTKDTATYGTERIPPEYTGALTKNFDTLKLAMGDPILPGSEPLISGTSGTLVARIRFFNPDLYSNSCLTEEQFSWKTGIPGNFTKLFFRRNGSINLINNDFSSFSTYDLCSSSFCCLEAPLYPPFRISPENNSDYLTAPVTLKWKKGFPINYSAYFQVSEDSGFTNVVFDSSLTAPDGTDDISVTLSLLTGPGSYYWRVKQGGIQPQGAFNEPWKFTISPASIALKLTVIPEGLYRYGNNGYELKAYLRNAKAPFELTDSSSVISTDSTYQNILHFTNAVSGMYYIEIKIPGCIETWSKEGGVYLSRDLTLNEYDFSLNKDQAYSGNEIFVRNKYCLYSGDVNRDCIIDLKDNIILYYKAQEFLNGDMNSDLNGDGIINLCDILISWNNSNNFIYARSPVSSNLNLNHSGNQFLRTP